jgi:hypothetical protein
VLDDHHEKRDYDLWICIFLIKSRAQDCLNNSRIRIDNEWRSNQRLNRVIMDCVLVNGNGERLCD